MKADQKALIIMIGIMLNIVLFNIVYDDLPIQELKGLVNSYVIKANNFLSPNHQDNTDVVEKDIVKANMSNIVVEEKIEEKIVYDNMTLEELTAKLDRSLTSTLSGTGHLFANRAVELGVDPYMAVAIVLLETGCAYDCSVLVNQCNNVGGMVGYPGCFGGGYQAFPTLEDGINSFMNNLYYNYISKGLKTPEQINPVYAESTEWASGVNYYINYIKAR